MENLRKVVRILFSLSLFLALNSGIYADAYYNTSTVEIPVECTVMKYFKDYEYQIAIEPQNENSPLPEESVITVPNGTMGFFRININEPDTFTYKIYEEIPEEKNKNINYDRRVYTLTVFVTDKGNRELLYSFSADRDDENAKTAKISFRDTERFVLESLVEKPSNPESEPESKPESTPESEPSVPEETSSPDTSKTIFTGDTSNMMLWVRILAISIILIPATLIKSSRKDN